uniref:Jumping translocation breakpoint n=2 Tax=Bos TaxID=9903 RepID=A0ABI0P5V4_BOVIN
MPAGAGRRGLPQGHHLCWLLCAFTLRLCQAEAPVREEKLSVSTSNLPCWLVEEFVVAEECAPCSNFQAKTTPECGSTGYVEKITCSSSKRSEFKSCRSALMEQRLFWKFEGAVIGLALVFACLVIVRQRQLDRKALEKDLASWTCLAKPRPQLYTTEVGCTQPRATVAEQYLEQGLRG